MVAAVAGVTASSHNVTPREACGWLKVWLKESVILRSTDKLENSEHQNVSKVFLHV